ncbi:MAG TPA: TIGR03619 family F420-dependent LLM class oxidoreductase [Pseudomonadales bacterium]|nr:TIGR03619 family F420-dependent LLM class oxidoreductase [Pseudomonadales bacterium]
MKFGIFGINFGVCADPEVAAEVAELAEELGFESLWTGEHVVLPDPQMPPSPAAPLTPMLHPSTALAYVAAVTEEIHLGTGITLIAQRNPVVLAKEMASLDVLSGGRLILGIGAGYLQSEFAALGIPFEERGRRTDEAIRVLRELWSSEAPEFDGEFSSFSGIQSRPRPSRRERTPIHAGGMSMAAYRRAVASCQGWYGFAMDLESTAVSLEALEGLEDEVPRPDWLGDLDISITPRDTPTVEDVEAYEDLGVDRLILLLPQRDGAAVTDFLERIADELLEDDDVDADDDDEEDGTERERRAR